MSKYRRVRFLETQTV